MANKKINLELDDNFFKKLFDLTDEVCPDLEDITLPVLKKQLLNIEAEFKKFREALALDPKKPVARAKKIREIFGLDEKDDDSDGPSQPSKVSSLGKSSKNEPAVRGKILIIDDLGVITFQLAAMFKKNRFEVATSNDIVNAIDLFKKNHFDFVLMDLFIPTQREGFILLDELVKISSTKENKTVIGVMSATNKKEYKVTCSQKGSAFFIEKTDTWQDELCRRVLNYE